ncbi:hypothetical protein [Methylobacterium sp. 391_Methyba4]|uniref:hypothetical protein n=1 Tax=Methylobacterium sp. 391_Methyba4 TaxID=3038924 RepID=UPI00242025CE|nr:hypothetical protein [Methylobacterium sp. 391_Methyba4]WFS07658.1 hypothetical protein P9K36_30655 [Methylobacterium sp. 391_Methyba4]
MATDEPCRREIATYEALFDAKPTTLAGAASLAAYMCDAVRTAQVEDKLSDGERALRTIADALRGLGPAADASLHPDAALFALGYEFISAWVSEEAVGNEAAYRECTHEAERIAQTPATTVAGLGIKALLLARLDSDDSGPNKPIAAQGPLASHWNVLRQIQEGAARLAAAPDMGIPMSAAAGPETDFPAPGSDAGDRLPAPRHDLSALSIAELARLHSAIVHAEEALGSAENRPCFSGDSRFGLTPAGWIINREAARLSQFLAAIAEEVGRRTPVEDDEREERLNTLVAHAVLAGGLGEHPKLIAEINATWGSAR